MRVRYACWHRELGVHFSPGAWQTFYGVSRKDKSDTEQTRFTNKNSSRNMEQILLKGVSPLRPFPIWCTFFRVTKNYNYE